MQIQPILKKNLVNNRILRLFYFSIAVFLSISLLCVGCFCEDKSPHSGGVIHHSGKNKPSTHSVSGKKGFGSNGAFPDTDESKPPIIFLAHGLSSDPSCFNFLKDELKKAFPHADIVSDEVTIEETAGLSIREQAKKCYEQLSKKPDVQNRPILLVGHSQGGLRMSELLFMCKKKGWDVRGLVPIAAPLEGAPIISNIESLKVMKKQFDEGIIDSLLRIFRIKDLEIEKWPGIRDLQPGSEFLSKLRSKLSTETIPILAIGAVTPIFQILSEEINPPSSIPISNQALVPLIVGTIKPNSIRRGIGTIQQLFELSILSLTECNEIRNDGAVPLSSQLGQNIFNRESKNVHTELINDTFHFDISRAELPIQGDFSLQALKGVLNDPLTAEKVIEFADKVGIKKVLK